MENRKNQAHCYRYIIFGLCFLMIFVVFGFGSSTKGTYLKAICDDLGFDRSVFSFNSSFQYAVSAILSFCFGWLVFKLGVRKMIATGFCFLVISFVIQTFALEIWHFYVSGTLLGAGICLTGTAVVSYVLGEWFPKNKGTIIGIALAANGIGGMVSELIITKLVYESETLSRNNPLVAWLSSIVNATG